MNETSWYQDEDEQKERNAPVTFYAELKWETKKAYLCYDGAEEFWIPKSQVIDKKDMGKGDFEITIPRWLADEKGVLEDHGDFEI